MGRERLHVQIEYNIANETRQGTRQAVSYYGKCIKIHCDGREMYLALPSFGFLHKATNVAKMRLTCIADKVANEKCLVHNALRIRALIFQR